LNDQQDHASQDSADISSCDTSVTYYDRNGDAFFEDTVGLDMTGFYEPFVATLPKNAHILDAGCGSGRDTRAFLMMGYRVTAIDLSEEMVIRARAFSGAEVQKRGIEDVDEVAVYDGVWSCASLLHVPQKNLQSAMSGLFRSLKPSGSWFLSFKNGSGERVEGERVFTDMNESALRQTVTSIGGLSVAGMWLTQGGRPGQETTWLCALLRKDTDPVT
jgi:2-polyprenyl-3-methyl-5-hydroxy-6-metoxy-1,4-benzoquinol methylase